MTSEDTVIKKEVLDSIVSAYVIPPCAPNFDELYDTDEEEQYGSEILVQDCNFSSSNGGKLKE